MEDLLSALTLLAGTSSIDILDMEDYLSGVNLEAGTSNIDQKWGLFIYRTTYDDQALWERYLAYVKAAIMRAIEPQPEPNPQISWDLYFDKIFRRTILRSRFELLTKDDEENLKSKSILELREEFRRWAATIPSEEKTGMNKPKYNHFLYVNKEILNWFQKVETARGDREPDYLHEDMIAVIVKVD
ncbi:hypothetical protein F5Y00DRAFT_266794 [Daldinia vernicosa]|uniref:uncharacterized protein n=1 Tax=Daldinia vernicosa TaxID=114800 RepID=UPI002008A4A0|nr:uncharacterized protein F5Y00DRAFT_266794 [Daldinia vernicosa]KAI0844183.1 hypothetical protein F5Y00DRAFT_266794 [Daldinia vernicosa]